MGFQKKRFSFEANELEDIKLKTLIGKNSYNQNDITKCFSLLIDDAYANSKGKKIRGM
jgi:hypothetical protein